MKDIHNKEPEIQELTLREQIEQYVKYWPWFVLFVIISMSVSLLYLRYATPIYQSVATILIKDEKNGALSELAAFQDLGFAGSLNQSGFENEMQILKSKSLTERVVRELNLNIKYISDGSIKSAELFENPPFHVSLLTPSDSLVFPFAPIYISAISEKEFELWQEDSEKKTYRFGDPISLSVGDIIVTPNSANRRLTNDDASYPLKVEISSMASTVAAYRQMIQIEQLTEFTSVIQLSLNSPNAAKSEAVLNAIQDAAIKNQNIFEHLMEAVKFCSLGEITDSLFWDFGLTSVCVLRRLHSFS